MNFTSNDPLEQVLYLWKNEPTVRENIALWNVEQARPARYAALSDDLHPHLQLMLKRKGIESLYTHQASSWRVIQRGEHTVIVTGTASGKTLCYHLPILDACLRAPQTRALCLYPTKALTQDQLKILVGYQRTLTEIYAESRITSAIYDGDTPTHLRSSLRGKTNIILTNPDMLHLSILPHHTVWMEFFRNLRFVVIDEMHIYRGVFGSHLANVIRRLKRVALFYGSRPQFILTSATIANPVELAGKLTEEEIAAIEEDGAPKGQRNFIFYNPPVVQPEIGVRKSASSEAIRLSSDLLTYHVQTLIFTRARRSVEIMLRNLRNQTGANQRQVRGYRSGYLPSERRQIEQELRTGQANAVVATNALELGIDIGSMDAAILVGYPGSIAATRQQAGRAGRRTASSLAVFIASASPLDQYLISHPEHILGKSPEQALIDPDNLLILLQHLRCAAFELPFKLGEPYGRVSAELVAELFKLLQGTGELHFSNDRYFWTADQYPANQVSLRTSSADRVRLQAGSGEGLYTIGEVDFPSALWMAHPGAIYLHEGTSYQVIDLDLEQHQALLKAVETDFFTEPVRKTTLQKIQTLKSAEIMQGEKCFGEVVVETKTVGFRRLRWHNNEVIDQEPLDLPTTQLRTTAYWLSLSEQAVDKLREEGLWVNDPINYGPDWNRQRNLARKRDQFSCQMCGAPEGVESHHVHHKIPFRTFTSYLYANQLENLVTLCASCHKKAEEAVRMRSGLAGLAYLLHHLSPLFIMCDINDLGIDFDPQSPITEGRPTVCVYDQIPAGIGLSDRLFDIQDRVFSEALATLEQCPCENGCPACVGPAGENGEGGKAETRAILSLLTGKGLDGITFR